MRQVFSDRHQNKEIIATQQTNVTCLKGMSSKRTPRYHRLEHFQQEAVAEVGPDKVRPRRAVTGDVVHAEQHRTSLFCCYCLSCHTCIQPPESAAAH